MPPPPPQSEYLAPDFDSRTLTIPQLRGILLEHGVTAPNPAKKADLVALFDDNVRPKADKILSLGRVKASNKGITVVSENGSETASVAEKAAPAKRRGRPPKKAPVAQAPIELPDDSEDELAEVEPEPPAKRPRGRPRKATIEPEAEIKPLKKARANSRQVATPVVEIPPATSARATPIEQYTGYAIRDAVKQEEADAGAEAEVEDEPTPAPASARKGKGRASTSNASPSSGTSAPSSVRRRTMNAANDLLAAERAGPGTPAKTPSKSRSMNSLRHVAEVKDESEQEDVPPPKSVKKTPRKSQMEDAGAFSDYNPFQSGSEMAAERERRRRKSSIGLSQSKPRQPRYSEPAPKSSTPTGILKRVGPSRENLRSPSTEHRDAMIRDRDAYSAEDYNREVEERFDLQRQVKPQEETARLADEPTHVSLVRKLDRAMPGAKTPQFAIPMSILLLLLLSLLGNYKSTSASLGFCDTGNDTNDLILNRQSKLDDARACIARRANLELDNPEAAKAIVCDVKSLPLIPFAPRPKSCTACPPHAVCQDGTIVSCLPEYILTAHPLAFLSPIADGLPGVGPKAFPPTCRPDTARKRMVGGLAMQMEKDLARSRGDIVCAGIAKGDAKKTDGVKFGVTEQTLKERYAARRDPKFTREAFDEIFDSALNDLVQHDDILESIDVEGVSWYAASRTELTLACRAKLEAVSLLQRWKSQLGSSLAVIATILWLRSTILRRKEEKYRAEELVQVVLKRLQDQETLHFTDPVTTANPFIPPAQLRDLVLPPTGSKTARNRLWQNVTDLIEANSNVAVREREVRGELWKTWEWQGVGERHVTWEK